MKVWVWYAAGILFLIGVQIIGLVLLSAMERFHRENAARLRTRNKCANPLIEDPVHADKMARDRA